MSWVRIDDRAPEHRKQLEAGPVACWLWVCGLAYANRQAAHDGIIATAALPMLYPIPGVAKHAQKLVDVGLWELVEGGYRVHDYHQYQPTKAVSEQLSAARAAAGRQGGKHSGEVRRAKQTRSNLLREGSKQGEANANPDPDPDPDPQRDPPVVPRGGTATRSKGTRLPENWSPSEAIVVRFRDEERVDALGSLERFTNYWTSKSGGGATKVSWDKTFTNWLLDDIAKGRAKPARAAEARPAEPDPEALGPADAQVHLTRLNTTLANAGRMPWEVAS